MILFRGLFGLFLYKKMSIRKSGLRKRVIIFSNLSLSLLVCHRSMADSVEQAADISTERRGIHREVRHMVDTGRIQEEE